MKYTGKRAEEFEREARLLLATFEPDVFGNRSGSFESFALDLARDYGIGDADIWDILAEYTE